MSKIVGWKDIPYSDEANQKLAQLKPGTAIAVRMRHVESSNGNPKVQIEFAEKISTGPVNMLAVLNADDDRFSSGARRAWLTASLPIATKLYGAIPKDEASVEILKELPAENGTQPRLLIREFLESEMTDSQKEYAENYYKRAGAEGNYFYSTSGEKVCSSVSLVAIPVGQEPQHTYIQGAFGTPETLSSVMGQNKPAVHGDVLQN